MYRIQGTIQGVAPILFNQWTPAGMDDVEKGTTGGSFTSDERMAEAMLKVYRAPSGELCIPGQNFKKCLVQGAGKAKLKEGRTGIGSLITPTVFADGDLIFTGKTQPDFIHSTTGRRPPRTGGACVIKRPALNTGWEVRFGLMVVDDRRSSDQLRRSLEEAGLLVGLGDWRPEYGRFIVSEWEPQR